MTKSAEKTAVEPEGFQRCQERGGGGLTVKLLAAGRDESCCGETGLGKEVGKKWEILTPGALEI